MSLKTIAGIQTITGKCGKVEIRDCLEGMVELEDNSFDLGLTDPPYNNQFKGNIGLLNRRKGYQKRLDRMISYNDNMKPEEYRTWCKEWFKELNQVTTRQIISPGLMNLSMWYRDQEVFDIIAINRVFGCFGSRIATFAPFQPWLCFGKFNQNLNHNVINDPTRPDEIAKDPWLHPTPKSLYQIREILSGIKPKSVLDNFGGSGTTFQICEELGIKYQGYEISKAYIPDIRKRIRRGISNSKTLDGWLKK